MLRKPLTLLALALAAICTASAEEVEITGTFQIRIGCADTYHEETPMVQVPGKDKFSSTRHALKLDAETKKKFSIGETITVKGKKRKAATKKMSKAQVREAIVQHTQHGEGLPVNCKGISEIISKIQINKPEGAAAGAHDHGELQLKPVDDDHELVDVYIMEHIEVTHIEAKN